MTDPPTNPEPALDAAVLVVVPIEGWRPRSGHAAAPDLVRLRQMLKVIGRAWGFRVTCVRDPINWELRLAERLERE